MADLNAEVSQFIRERIDSVETLHVLLILRESPDRNWTVEGLSRELRSSVNAIRQRVDRLCAGGLAAIDADAVRYEAPPREDAIVAQVVEHYRIRRMTVIDLIFSSGPDPLRSFSDAFKLREEKP